MLFPDLDEGSKYFRRSDPDETLGSFSANAFKLDDREWPTIEHYFQAMKFSGTDEPYLDKICQASSPKEARKLGRKNRKHLRKDWSKVKRVVMTRAVYTSCKTHAGLSEALLATGEQKLVENSQYDYYWGCGRDRRGENVYGQVLMDVRRKLRQELDV